MYTINNVLWGIGLLTTGTLVVKFSFQLVRITGSQQWIESKLGSGTTYAAYKFAGVACVFAGVLFLSGLNNGFFGWLLSPLVDMFTGGK
jgi:hypothetical protein